LDAVHTLSPLSPLRLILISAAAVIEITDLIEKVLYKDCEGWRLLRAEQGNGRGQTKNQICWS
jgi:hypothetical protein